MSLNVSMQPAATQFGARRIKIDASDDTALAALVASTAAPVVSSLGSSASAGSAVATASSVGGSGSVAGGSGLMTGPQSSAGAGVIHLLQNVGLGGVAKWMAAHHLLGGAGLTLLGSSVLGQGGGVSATTAAGSKLGK